MKIGKTTGWLISLSASAFLHAAALSAVKFFLPHGRNLATETAKDRIQPVELLTLKFEPEPQVVNSPVTPLPIPVPEITRQESVRIPEPGPAGLPEEKPSVLVPRWSGNRSAPAVPTPVPPEPAAEQPAAPAPVPPPEESTTWVTVNGQPFPIHVTSSGLLPYPVPSEEIETGSLASSSDSPQTQRNIAVELGLTDTPSGQPPQPHTLPPADADPIPSCREVGGGFACRITDPTIARHLGTDEHLSEREYLFSRQANGDFIYRDPDRHNEIIIHPDGTMEDRTNIISRAEDIGLIYQVFNIFSGNLPWDIPRIPHYMWSAAETATAETRQRLAEQYDNSVTREALDNLFQDLSDSIGRHPEWSLAQQHDFLFRRWDECREDSVGNEARTIILQYVLAHYPQGSPLEFTGEELRGFNDRRQTESQLFNPYPD